MADILLLHLAGPMMSFGAPQIDNNNPTYDFPTRSMMTGLLGAALGIDRDKHEQLGALQSALRMACREDRRGTPLLDYHTVDLGQPHLSVGGWTTNGQVETRGGASGDGTHIRYRHYLVNARYTVALTLLAGPAVPSLKDIQAALLEPVHPIFLGRKSCPPSERIFGTSLKAAGLLEALNSQVATRTRVWWSADEPAHPAFVKSRELVVYDRRDWANRIHTGRSILHEGFLLPSTATSS